MHFSQPPEKLQADLAKSLRKVRIESEYDTGALWQCATCREAGTPENPLAMLAAVVPWQSKSSHRGGLPGYARFTSCRHLVHAVSDDMF
ncbi:hypothetical protein AK812_SmicGene24061 [Symbiodinium microadriaticum]|uniref:Uncharacterized protein n=1 Tax=Symbiodinium microadriaticum TaxID=2951 RepID=A0A1Q9DFJ3_SYMMI|nr:hypothetical protein AK812_SmicGene24061 [Symbiodinium microadriaticum]